MTSLMRRNGLALVSATLSLGFIAGLAIGLQDAEIAIASAGVAAASAMSLTAGFGAALNELNWRLGLDWEIEDPERPFTRDAVVLFMLAWLGIGVAWVVAGFVIGHSAVSDTPWTAAWQSGAIALGAGMVTAGFYIWVGGRLEEAEQEESAWRADMLERGREMEKEWERKRAQSDLDERGKWFA